MNLSRFCVFDKPLPYPEAVSLQEVLVKSRIQDEICDTFLLLQPPPLLTLGRRARTEFLLADDEYLQKAGIEKYVASRGGDITYHGPGQWVLYPIIKLSPNEMGAHGYLHALESVALQTAERFQINAFRKEGKAGAWSESGKFAAVGFKFTRWVTSHGMSLNVCPDMQGFELIVGCGLVGEKVTSFLEILGSDKCPQMDTVGREVQKAVENIFDRGLDIISPDQLFKS